MPLIFPEEISISSSAAARTRLVMKNTRAMIKFFIKQISCKFFSIYYALANLLNSWLIISKSEADPSRAQL